MGEFLSYCSAWIRGEGEEISITSSERPEKDLPFVDPPNAPPPPPLVLRRQFNRDRLRHMHEEWVP